LPQGRISGKPSKPSQMTNIRLLTVLAAICLTFLGQTQAQTSENRWMAGLSAVFMDYQGPLTGDYLQARSWNPGITMGAHAYLNPLLNLSVNSSFVPEAIYPLGENNFLSTSLIDANVLTRIKANNGKLLREDAVFAPYIGTGFGVNSASNNVRLYVPAVLGIQFQVSQNFSLQIETTYKQSIKKGDIHPLTHTAGFVFALPDNGKPKRPEPDPDPDVEDMEMLADADKDGVPDRDDICPDEKGKAMYLGCPDAPADENEDIAEAQPQDPTPQQPVQEIEVQQQPAPQIDQVMIDDGQNEQFQPAEELRPVSQADLAILEDAMSNVYFEQGSDILKPESLNVLDEVAMVLERNPQYNLDVLGHTDNTGDHNSNLVLSIKRAFKVKYYLVYEKNVRMSRIASDGYSSAAPKFDNDTAEGRAKNRRVEFKLHPTK
ncbi:MAG: OmpA family protein, partial [Bacteroidota bacterium]